MSSNAITDILKGLYLTQDKFGDYRSTEVEEALQALYEAVAAQVPVNMPQLGLFLNQLKRPDDSRAIVQQAFDKGATQALAGVLTNLRELFGMGNLEEPQVTNSQPQLADNPVAEKYQELLLAVGNKYEGETRHQTALRYIRRAEQGNDLQVSDSEATKKVTSKAQESAGISKEGVDL